ncbi:hypothetical protein [Arthrobacter sp. StoSoilB20]|uniref:hypothetical protein n=1 Tax=Arthrobacter sp. StoSoilB20 TaxID=2830995 RepID=UPI001CC36450|nr:hypothetical protein [Arthrobacter sp. StoSoilB20]BCW59993.1 hypothetical protein StoSoilB20_33400 [Arthrobacter sp. StoSoilB20]
MQTSDMLVNALGGLVRIRLDLAGHAFDMNLAKQLQEPWKDAEVGREAVIQGTENDISELLWPFPDQDGFAGSVAELSTHTTLAAIEAQRGTLLMLHAAGIADDSGHVLAFIGPSGRGKTTLARELGAVYGYVTDETVGIDLDGTVHPYRKPLSVIQPGEIYKAQVAPSDLELKGLPARPLQLAGLVLLSRVQEIIAKADVTDVGLCEALAALVPEASYLADLDKPLQTIAKHVDRCGAIQRLTYTDAVQVLPVISKLMRRSVPEAWVAVLPSDSSGVRNPFAAERFVPAPVMDAVEADGQTAILDADRVVHVLDGVGPLVWRLLCEGFDFESLASEVDHRFGSPPEQSLNRAVVGVFDALVDAGLVVRVSVPAP